MSLLAIRIKEEVAKERHLWDWVASTRPLEVFLTENDLAEEDVLETIDFGADKKGFIEFFNKKRGTSTDIEAIEAIMSAINDLEKTYAEGLQALTRAFKGEIKEMQLSVVHRCTILDTAITEIIVVSFLIA